MCYGILTDILGIRFARATYFLHLLILRTRTSSGRVEEHSLAKAILTEFRWFHLMVALSRLAPSFKLLLAVWGISVHIICACELVEQMVYCALGAQ